MFRQSTSDCLNHNKKWLFCCPMATRTTTLLLFFVSLVVVVHGHHCPPFQITDAGSQDYFLGRENVPVSFQRWVTEQGTSAVINGVVDCHNGEGEHYVGYTGGCTADGNCFCTAIYNSVYQECSSCKMNCGTGTDGLNLTEATFSADCSNVESPVAAEDDGACMVQCGFETYACFEGDPGATSSATSRSTKRTSVTKMAAAAVGTVLLSSWFVTVV